MEKEYVYYAVVRSVYDGDTIRADIDLGFDNWIMNTSLRLYGIDTPEISGVERPEGLIAKEFVLERIPPGKKVIIKTIKDKRGKYGRYLAIIYYDGIDLNEELITNGLAERYLV